MSNSKGQSYLKSLMNNGKNSLLPPKSPFPTIPPSYTEYIPNSSVGTGVFLKGKDENPLHHRASSESFSMEEQPSWLDELLDEPETPVRRGCHRRSSSDSFAYVEVANNLGIGNMNMNYVAHDDNKYKNVPSWGPQDFNSFGNSRTNTFKMDVNSSGKMKKGPWNSPVGSGMPHRSIPSPRVTTVASNADAEEKQDQVEHGAKDPNHSDEKKDSSHAKSSEAETKRAKQQFAQRSRVRKLQYIAELERNVQALQADGSEISAEIEFLNQQNLILSMENKALRQRLESLSQEQRIKYFEHEVLEREVQRLKSLYMQQQQQKPQVSSSHRRSNSKDLDQQFANLSLKHKEANPDLNSISGQLHM